MNFKEQLKSEGFPFVFEWTDAPDTIYTPHLHKGRVTFYITKGEIAVDILGKKLLITEGKRLDVPPAVIHSAKVGPQGCSFVVGEEIEGDA
jgi:quercetin dioxygenase-like cupin family protein